MKNLLLIVFTFSLFANLSYAQPILKPTASMNISGISKSSDFDNATGQASWQGGVSIAYGDDLYGEIGAFFVNKSTDLQDSLSQEYMTEFEGVRIPVSIGYQIIGNENSRAGVRIFGGGSLFWITDVQTDLNYTKDDFKPRAGGVFAGLGVDFLFLFAETKYEWSLTELSEVPDFMLGTHRSFFLSAGLRVPI
ncbi:hypothetical protein OKW21_006239 [Catalinimonas alkaloidigena]|uniref:hypothetical protein n=1 Tax=Catalinimonas alkaloidigena TaxID=1075417 RepID=UPI0024062B38|nr:hypothetical protein [Catalinimonas alkaloidigena]MDF9800976.1 hypothetical protein [Catalinimonas alkaloidigena]